MNRPFLDVLRNFAARCLALAWILLPVVPVHAPAQTTRTVTGLQYYAVVDLTSGTVVQRGTAGGNGVAFDQLILGANQPYRIYLLEAATFFIAEQSLVTPDNGTAFQFAGFVYHASREPDTDRDGLQDDGELVMGTDPRNPDSDGDGVSDAAEVQAGQDPLTGVSVRTGIVGSVQTPGPALDVCAINNLALVALGPRGLAVYNIFAGLDPVGIAFVDTPGDALRVACTDNLVAVADGPAGLAIIDLSDPPAARITRQIPLGGSAVAVATAGSLAVAGLSNGDLVVVDMLTGEILSRRALGQAVADVAFGRDLLFALTDSAVHALQIVGGDLDLLSSANSPYLAAWPHQRLTIGDGFLHAVHGGGFNTFSISASRQLTLERARQSGAAGWRQLALTGSGTGLAAVGPQPFPDPSSDIGLYDVANASGSERLLTTFPTPGVARSVSLFNGLLYCADDASGLQILNYLPRDTRSRAPNLQLETSATVDRVEEGSLFAVTARATDDVQVRNVEFYVDGVLASTDGSYPFELRFIAPKLGTGRDAFTVQASATDTGGNRTNSAPLTFRLVPDARPPRVARFTPRDGSLHQALDSVGVYFNEPLDEASLTSSNLVLRSAGPDRIFGTTDDAAVNPVTVSYQADSFAAFVTPTAPLAPGRYRLEATPGLRDRGGNPLAQESFAAFGVYDVRLDADGDGLSDTLELLLGLDPAKDDSDNDLVRDGDEDFDGDGLSNAGELILGADLATPDTNGDGLRDGDEDSDGDGLRDGEEVIAGTDRFVTNPLLADSDGDAIDDGAEVGLGLNPVDARDGGKPLVLEGKTYVASGRIQVPALTLRNNAVLTHAPYPGGRPVGLTLIVETLTVDSTSRIDVTGAGYPGGLSRYNQGQQLGRTEGNRLGSIRRSGGSHGGLGGFGNIEQQVNPVYDDPLAPAAFGSGGGSDSGPGGDGGGAVRIAATRVVIDGRLLANGSPGDRFAGGGAGGTIALVTRSLSGAGVIAARGGNAGSEAGGGGGGRIAITAETAESTLLEGISAEAGTGFQPGGAGTILTQIGTQLPALVVRGVGRETVLPALRFEGVITLDASRVAGSRIEATQLILTNGAVLTHLPARGDQQETGLDLQVTRLDLAASTAIDLTGRGYPGALSAANPGAQRGMTLDFLPGSFRRTGGSHGGLGAAGNTGESANAVYGDFRQPSTLGAGGGSDGGAGGAGGGRLHVRANAVRLDGAIRANGDDGSRFAGGGAGGSVWIEAPSLSGTGIIQANGGQAGSEAGGGGGGRMALLVNTVEASLLNALQAVSGAGLSRGGPGTIYLREATQTAKLMVRGPGIETPLPAEDLKADLILDNATVSSTNVSAQALSLINAATLTHPAGTPTSQPALRISADTVLIDATSRIDLSGRGRPGGLSRGNATQSGMGAIILYGSGRRAGGSHAGLGGAGSAEGLVQSTYGAELEPVLAGSGGGSDSTEGGAGGGVLRLTSNSLTVHGEILSSGFPGSRFAGGGAGGSVWISTSTLNGSGRIRADGGSGGTESGSGGGGRISITCVTPPAALTDTILENLSAISPSDAYSRGASGTLFIRRGTDPGRLIVRGPGRESPAPANFPSLQLVIDGATVSGTRLEFDSLHLVGGARLTHPPASLTNTAFLEIVARRVELDAASRIDATGRGYLGGRTGDNNLQAGRTLGNQPGSTQRTGGSYGGLGAVGFVGSSPNSTYGSWRTPHHPGSGGGSESEPGGSGGGLVRLVADTLLLDGEILAHGQDGSRFTGGGSGGGVHVTVESISGTGAMRANGGQGGSESGSGGGGRIAVHTRTASGFDWRHLEARGGLNALLEGSPGTVFVRGPTHRFGDLVIDARVDNHASVPTPIWMSKGGTLTALSRTTLTDTNAGFVPGALSGLRVRPDARRTNTWLILENDATTLTLDPIDGNPTEVATVGASYSIPLQIDRLILRDGALAELVEANQNLADRSALLSAVDLTLSGNSVLTHPVSTARAAFGLTLELVGTLDVDASSRVDVSAKGYLGALRPGNPGQFGMTEGFLPGGGPRDGGSHGGLGGRGNGARTIASVYGDYRAPYHLGGGGGSESEPGGIGGGRMKIQANAAILNGRLIADGGNGARFAGGGAGGTIQLRTSSLTGTGSLSARGANAGSDAGGGGGGRILVSATAVTGFDRELAVANGGTGLEPGAPGTVYLTLPGEPPTLRVGGTSRETPLPTLDPADSLDLRDGARVYATKLDVVQLWIRSNAVLTHLRPVNAVEFGLNITVSNLWVEAGGSVDVSGRGYAGGLSGDNAFPVGVTRPDRTGSTRRNGGSHGGRGGVGNAGGTVNEPYGDPQLPTDLGSGGGSESGPAGDGGGRIRITATQATVAGDLRANGTEGSRFGGGGAGGTVHIKAARLALSGRVQANGGVAGSESGGGGGGRIVVQHGPASTLGTTPEAVGGKGFTSGTEGTVVILPFVP